MTMAARNSVMASFALEIGRLDDRPALLDLVFLEGGVPFRRLLLLGGDVETELGELCLGGRVGEYLHHRAVELPDLLLRGALGRPEPGPSGHIESGHAGFVRGRDI